MKDDGFRFSHDKRFGLGKIEFDYFLENANKLDQIVRANRQDVETKVLTCEDIDTYNWGRVTIVCDIKEQALKNRKSYSLEDYNTEVWTRSFNSQLTIRAPLNKNSFMITLSYDVKDPKRISFYGQCIDNDTNKSVHDNFSKPSWMYKLGDGFSKPNMDDFFRTRVGFALSRNSICLGSDF